jgi:hypothetical protein
MRKTVIAAIAFTVVTPFVFLGTASAADAATPSCNGTLNNTQSGSCFGLTAANTTCVNDAEVIYNENIYDGDAIVGNIQLKYSPSCRSAWARVISDLTYGSYAWVSNAYGEGQGCTGNDTPGTGCNTRMVDDGNTVSDALGEVYYDRTQYVSLTTSSY